MVEIRYKDRYEVVELAGQTVSEARQQFREEFGIRDKARARLNGTKIKPKAEGKVVLKDDDSLVFAASHNVGLLLVGALLLALVVTGGMFAYGFINGSTTLSANIIQSNFAEVSVHPESTNITWTGFGFFKGSIGGPNGLFRVNPAPGYTGDLVVSVSLGNADQLAKRYRMLALRLEMVNASNNATIDINESGTADANDWVLLTLENGTVSMFPEGTTANLTIRVVNGFYVTHVHPFGGWQGSAAPDIFCEVGQR